MGEYLTGLFQPWRRVTRQEFLLAITLLTLPGFILMFIGVVGSGGNLLASMADLPGLIAAAQGGDPHALGQLTGKLAAAGQAGDASVPLTHEPDFGGLITGLCLLLLSPFVRGRWQDLGQSGPRATVLTLLTQLSVLNSLLVALSGAGPLPYAPLFTLLTFLLYTWLTFKGGKARKAVHERLVPNSPFRRDDDDFPPPRF